MKLQLLCQNGKDATGCHGALSAGDKRLCLYWYAYSSIQLEICNFSNVFTRSVFRNQQLLPFINLTRMDFVVNIGTDLVQRALSYGC